MTLLRLALLACLLPGGACGESPSSPLPPDDASLPVDAAPTRADAPADAPLVAFLGDSLTEGYGLRHDQAYPALLAETFAQAGRPIRVRNAGVSGDTSAGGRARLDWVLRERPDVLVVALGGNDGLRGLPVAQLRENLADIVVRARAAGAAVLLAGMAMPPNYGPEYTRAFREVYPELAEQLDVPLVPFLLEGVAGDPALNLGDGLHPNAAGQRVLADLLAPHLERLLPR